MDFWEVIKTRRSIRSYQSKEIEEEKLTRIIEAARIAPSGNNKQPCYFIIVKDPSKKKQIAQACYNQTFIGEAPVVIVCCAKKYITGHQPWGETCYILDTIIAIDHLILAARNEGIGSCWIGAFYPEKIKTILNLKEELEIIMIVPLGYPKKEDSFKEFRARKSMDEICEYI